MCVWKYRFETIVGRGEIIYFVESERVKAFCSPKLQNIVCLLSLNNFELGYSENMRAIVLTLASASHLG